MSTQRIYIGQPDVTGDHVEVWHFGGRPGQILVRVLHDETYEGAAYVANARAFAEAILAALPAQEAPVADIGPGRLLVAPLPPRYISLVFGDEPGILDTVTRRWAPYAGNDLEAAQGNAEALNAGGSGWSWHDLVYAGFDAAATASTTPAPQLPTDPGAYSDRDGDVWVLTDNGEWFYVEDGHDSIGEITDPENYLPMTRLVPATDQ